ncbi:hypothetical protein OSB04_030120, partial [Centaurea solstitialis]
KYEFLGWFICFSSKLANVSYRSTEYCKSGKKIGNCSIYKRRFVCSTMASQNLTPTDNFRSSKFNRNLGIPVVEFRIRLFEFVYGRFGGTDVLIECKDVYKSFGEKHILRGINYGEAVGIIGPSGTGKSTILKIIAGLLTPDKGEVYIRGRKRHGLISDDDMSAFELAWYENSRMPDDEIQELVAETLAAVGLKDVEDRMPSELSGGMKKRVALARSIIFDTASNTIEPEVLLYDEPTAGLDPIASTVVEDLIRSVHCKGEDALGKPGKIASYVVVTHQHSTIKRAVDRLVFLHEGKVVWEGMTHEFTSSTNPIVQQFASGNLDGPIRD